MKTIALFLSLAAFGAGLNPLNAQDGGPRLTLEHRILEIEVDMLLDAYGEVFRDLQHFQNAALHVEMEAGGENAGDIEKEARRLERGMGLVERRLGKLRRDLEVRIQRLEVIRHEHHERLAEMEQRERAVQQERQLVEEAMERERAVRRENELRAHERRERSERIESERDRPRMRTGEAREKDVEVKVFVDGREVQVDEEERIDD